MSAARGVDIEVYGLPVSSSAEDSPSGLWRSLGKRVGGDPSRVQIPHPPPLLVTARTMNHGTDDEPAHRARAAELQTGAATTACDRRRSATTGVRGAAISGNTPVSANAQP